MRSLQAPLSLNKILSLTTQSSRDHQESESEQNGSNQSQQKNRFPFNKIQPIVLLATTGCVIYELKKIVTENNNPLNQARSYGELNTKLNKLPKSLQTVFLLKMDIAVLWHIISNMKDKFDVDSGDFRQGLRDLISHFPKADREKFIKHIGLNFIATEFNSRMKKPINKNDIGLDNTFMYIMSYLPLDEKYACYKKFFPTKEDKLIYFNQTLFGIYRLTELIGLLPQDSQEKVKVSFKHNLIQHCQRAPISHINYFLEKLAMSERKFYLDQLDIKNFDIFLERCKADNTSLRDIFNFFSFFDVTTRIELIQGNAENLCKIFKHFGNYIEKLKYNEAWEQHSGIHSFTEMFGKEQLIQMINNDFRILDDILYSLDDPSRHALAEELGLAYLESINAPMNSFGVLTLYEEYLWLQAKESLNKPESKPCAPQIH